MAQSLPSQPIAFVVTLNGSASEAEAQVIRSAIRAFAHVATVAPVGSSPALTAAQERARAETEAALNPIYSKLQADVRASFEAATEEMDGILQAPLDVSPGWQQEVARTPSRNGNGLGTGAQRAVNGARNGQVPQQRDPRHAAPRGVTPGR